MFHRFFAVQFIGVCSLCLMAGCSWMGDYSPLASVERSLIFQPAMHPNGDWEPRQLEFENVEFEAADGTKLHGWFVPHEHPRAVVLFAHGNAGNLTQIGRAHV